jgi:hypothetical protein
VFDYYRILLPAFFGAAFGLSVVAPICLLWPPVLHLGPIYLFGPLVAALLWLVVVVLALRVHRWRGLWVLLTALVMLPGAYLYFTLVWGCLLFGACL